MNGYRIPILPNKTFQDLCEYWLTHRAPQKRSERSDRSIIELHLRPFFGKRFLRDIGEPQIDDYKGLKALSNKKTLLNHLTLLGAMLRLGQRLRWIAQAPVISKPKFSIYSKNFRYLKTEDEIRIFLKSASNVCTDAFVLYSVAIYTGLRQGELAGLKWTDVDLDRRLITVQRSFEGPTKGGEIRYVPILDPVLPLLKNLKTECRSEYVFPNRVGKMLQPSARIFQEKFHRVLESAGFPLLQNGSRSKRYIVFHDLRHTFASHWVMRGGDVFKLQKILGHKDIKMTMRYAHVNPDAFVSDFGRFGNSLPINSYEHSILN
jgi:integrase